MSDSLMVDGHGGGGGASAVAMGNGEGVTNSDAEKVVYRKQRNRGGGGGTKERFTNPNGVFSRPKSEYISPCELPFFVHNLPIKLLFVNM